jgi:tRNA threonylcarbamoyladenosine biosynthesis protein TsaB
VIVLGVDTASLSGSVALVEGTQVVASLYLRQLPTFSSHILRIIDLVCAQAGCHLADLGGLAVNLGPGAFTSLRVGLATVQGLALAHGKPVVGCSALDALVACMAGWKGIVCPMMEARRGEVYAAFYRHQGETFHEIMPGMVITPRELCRLVRERTLFLGSGVQVYSALLEATLGDRAVCLETEVDVAMAVSVARLAQMRLRVLPPTICPVLTPLYMRAADARLPPYAIQGTGIALESEATPGL